MISTFKDILAKYGLEYWNKYYGVYRGFVADVDDPENLGRVKVQVPTIYANTFNYWALPKGGFAGNGVGSFMVPNVGDPIWVEFEGGDCRFPVWSGGWFARGYAPSDAAPKVRVIQTDKHKVVFDDNDGTLQVSDNNNNMLLLNSTGVSLVSGKISLGAEDGSAEKAALGDTLLSKLQDIVDSIDGTLTEMSTITTLVAGVPVPISPTNQATIAVKKAQLAVLKGQLGTILSNKVTLD